MTAQFQCAPERAAPGDTAGARVAGGPGGHGFNALLNAQPPGTHTEIEGDGFGATSFNALLNAQPPGTS